MHEQGCKEFMREEEVITECNKICPSANVHAVKEVDDREKQKAEANGERAHEQGHQRRATRLIPSLARLSYEERLKETGLYTRERRQVRGDMMEMFKIVKGIDKISADELFNRVNSNRTRGHSLRVKKSRVKRWQQGRGVLLRD